MKNANWLVLGAAGLATFCLLTTARARDIFVHPDVGNDGADGLAATAEVGHGPVRTIARGIKLAGPGDTVHLAAVKSPYRETAIFVNRSGEPERPITLDGHGATLTGAAPLVADEWDEVSPGLYRSTKLFARLRVDDATIGRWFFLFDGQMQRMGRTSKGPSQPLWQPADLQPGEWTIVKDEKALYVRIASDQMLNDARIEAPSWANGVSVHGTCAHLLIKNLTVTHVYNDGCNLHGKCRDVVLQDFRAIECGDDGISSHDDCHVKVEGFYSRGNSTGMCHTGQSVTETDRMLVEGCHGYDVFLLDDSVHTITNSLVRCAAAMPFSVVGRKEDVPPCKLTMTNVLIDGRGAGSRIMRLYQRSRVTATNVTVLGLDIVANGESVEWNSSILAGDPPPTVQVMPPVVWQGQDNLYDLKHIRVGDKSFTAETLADVPPESVRETGTKWKPVKLNERFNLPLQMDGRGADVAKLVELESNR